MRVKFDPAGGEITVEEVVVMSDRCRDQQAEIERLRVALRRILDEIHLGGGEDELSIDTIHDTAKEALRERG